MQPLSGNQRPDLLTSLMNTSFVLRLPREMHLGRSSSNVHGFWKCDKALNFCSLLTRCTIPCACHAKRHLNLQKWREHVVLCTFWLRNLLRATRACTFSTSQLPKAVRHWCDLCILTSKCASRHNGVHFFDKCASPASRHNGVHFFISHLARWLRTRRFLASLLFDPPEPQNHWKNTVFRGFSTFSRICIFFLLTLSLLSSSLFCSSLLPASAQLCFSSVHIVGSLTSKLPSNISIVGSLTSKLPSNISIYQSIYSISFCLSIYLI